MRNERAFIVIMAYIIGFTTAYILFGMNQTPNSELLTKKNSVAENTEMPKSVGTMVKPDGLYALVGDRERVLSAQVISAEQTNKLGYHEKVVVTSVSNDGRFIYYCTAPAEAGDKCFSFIYDIENDVVHRVIDETATPIVSASDSLTVTWGDDNSLLLNNYVTVNVENPWLLNAK